MPRYEFAGISPEHRTCDRCSAPTHGFTFLLRNMTSHWLNYMCVNCVARMFECGTAANPEQNRAP